MRTWQLLVGLGVGLSSVGLWRALPAQAEAPVKPVEAAKPAGSTAKPAAPSKAAAKPKCKWGMVGIPAATFTPIRGFAISGETVTVAAYCIDRTEVTTSAYAKCVKSGECTAAEKFDYQSTPCNAGIAGRGNHPINCVQIPQATAFCEAQGQRLPTEVEWEYAATGADGRNNPWGDAEPADQLCWNRYVEGKSYSTTCAVGSFPKDKSPFGLVDMGGNVSEFTSDCMHGSSWFDSYPRSVNSSISTNDPNGRATIGFRCAGSPLP